MTLNLSISPPSPAGQRHALAQIRQGCPRCRAARAVNAKAKGTRQEHRSIARFEAVGYQCCRNAASLGVWDIVGITSENVVRVQVKTRDARLGQDGDCQGARGAAQLQEADPPMARWATHARCNGAVMSAPRTVYQLWCCACHRLVEVPARSVQDGVGRCPKCDARLEIPWGEVP